MSSVQSALWAPAPSTSRGQATKLDGSANGDKLVYTSGRGVFVRDLRNPAQSLAYLEHVKEATVARLSPSGAYCASADVTGAVRVWDVLGTDRILKSETKVIAGRINDLAWGESTRIIAVGDGKQSFGHAFMFDTSSSCGSIEGHSKVANAVAIRQQRPFRAATGGDDGTIVFYTGVPFKFAKVIKTHSSFVQSLSWAPSGAHFASAGADRKVFVHDGQTGDLVHELVDGGATAHTGGVFASSFSPDSRSLATSSADQTVKLWDVETKKVVHFTSSTPANLDQQVGNTYAGDSIVSLSASGDLNVLDPRTGGKPTSIIYGHQRGVTAIARDSSSSTLVSGSYDGRVCTWSSAGVASPVTGSGHTNALVGVVAAGQSVLTAAMDDSIREVDVSSSSFAASFASTSTLPKGIDAASDGTAFVATASDVQIVKGGKKLFGLPVNYAPTAIAATRDGKQVAVGAEDGKVYIYASSGSTLDLKSTLTANRSAVSALAFSPDGALLAAGEASGKVLLLNAASGSFEVKTSRWSYHTGRILALAWSPDGAHVASASLDTHVYVWSVAAPLKKVAIKNAHPGGATSVAWADDATLISAGVDGTIRHHAVTHG